MGVTTIGDVLVWLRPILEILKLLFAAFQSKSGSAEDTTAEQ